MSQDVSLGSKSAATTKRAAETIYVTSLRENDAGHSAATSVRPIRRPRQGIELVALFHFFQFKLQLVRDQGNKLGIGGLTLGV